jgi:hypothetical protein
MSGIAGKALRPVPAASAAASTSHRYQADAPYPLIWVNSPRAGPACNPRLRRSGRAPGLRPRASGLWLGLGAGAPAIFVALFNFGKLRRGDRYLAKIELRQFVIDPFGKMSAIGGNPAAQQLGPIIHGITIRGHSRSALIHINRKP